MRREGRLGLPVWRWGDAGRRRATRWHAPERATLEEKQHGLLDERGPRLAEQGMEKASMAQIASQSEVSKALLYHYYPSKDVLLFAIIHTHLVELEASVAAAVDQALSPEDQLGVLVGVVLEKYRGADDAHKVQRSERRALGGAAGRDPSASRGGSSGSSRRCSSGSTPTSSTPIGRSDACDDVTLRDVELGLHVVPRGRDHIP